MLGSTRNLLVRIAACALLAGGLFDSAAHAATACKSASCSGTCTPGAPVAISTLISLASGNTPIAFVDPADNLAHRFIVTQQGQILVWDGATNTVLATPFIDLRSGSGGPVLYDGNERGLLAMAVEPDYETTGRFYVYYTRSDGDLTLARYQRSANPNVADTTATVLLVIEHSSAGNHNGGWLAFGPDGFLYLSTGDGGGGCDGNLGSNGDGQRNDTLLGKMLRIDVRGVDPSGGPPDSCGTGANYTVPSTNPFFGQTTPCGEVFLMGLRNPFRYSFDSATGDLFIGDVGQDNWEEIDVKRAATPPSPVVNFGWPCREGCSTSNNSPSSCGVTGCPADGQDTTNPGMCFFNRATGFVDPILCHSNPAGWAAMMGGYRYRGSRVPSINGSYFYGDLACGQIWKTTTLDTSNPAGVDSSCWASGFGGIYGFAQDHIGELYVIQGSARTIDCVHNGLGCFWAGFRGLHEDGFESGGLTRWSASQ